MEGLISISEIRYGTFCVLFEFDKQNPITHEYYAMPSVDIEDLELVESHHVTDEAILEDLPGRNPNWWCKVENGYIMNLKGEKKNKIPYKYDS